jgi:HK97 gp10 family phage protein
VPKITGAKAFSAKLKALSGPEMTREVGKALFVAGNTIQVEAQLSITNGAVSGKNHVPSKPGQPPNQDTGVLADNIETVLVEPLKVEVSSNAPYAAALEYGTARMAPRPYMAPAVEKSRKEVTELVRGAVSIVIKRAGGVRGQG